MRSGPVRHPADDRTAWHALRGRPCGGGSQWAFLSCAPSSGRSCRSGLDHACHSAADGLLRHLPRRTGTRSRAGRIPDDAGHILHFHRRDGHGASRGAAHSSRYQGGHHRRCGICRCHIGFPAWRAFRYVPLHDHHCRRPWLLRHLFPPFCAYQEQQSDTRHHWKAWRISDHSACCHYRSPFWRSAVAEAGMVAHQPGFRHAVA